MRFSSIFSRFSAPTVLAAIAILAAGCSHAPSPAIGTWQAGAGDATTLTLRSDGSGTLSAPALPALDKSSVAWTADSQDATKVHMNLTPAANGAAASSAAAGQPMAFLGIVAPDGKTLTLAFPTKTFVLTRSEGSAATP